MISFQPKHRLSIVATFLLTTLASTANARPNMWWDHFESVSADQVECVKQAETILSNEKAGHLSIGSDSVRAWTDKTISVAECIPFGDKLVVAVLISSDDTNAGNALFNALRSGLMKK